MGQREQFDNVADSIRNGQRVQAFRQMQKIGVSALPTMLDYLSNDLADMDLALDAAKTYFNVLARYTT